MPHQPRGTQCGIPTCSPAPRTLGQGVVGVGADRHQPQGQVSPGQGAGKDAHPPSPQQATQGSLLGSGPSIPPTMCPPLTRTAPPPPRIPPREHVPVWSPTRSSRHAGCGFTSTSYECTRLACNSGFGRNCTTCPPMLGGWPPPGAHGSTAGDKAQETSLPQGHPAMSPSPRLETGLPPPGGYMDPGHTGPGARRGPQETAYGDQAPDKTGQGSVPPPRTFFPGLSTSDPTLSRTWKSRSPTAL